MTEKEKMIAGELYTAIGEELTEERRHAKSLCFQINQLSPLDVETRKKLFRRLLGKIGGQFTIEQPFYCDYGYNIFIGEQFYANHNLLILDCTHVTIGDHVMIGPNVSIFAAGHPLDALQRRKEIEFAKPVRIGNDVWIGGGTVINPGVSIGDNVVIGSGSVVTKDIPSNCVAVGNPCRVLKALKELEE